MNEVTLIGNLGADPEIRSTPSGNRVMTLSVATSKRWKDKAGAEQESTQWHRVIAWGWVVDAMEGLIKKGSRVLVKGEVTYRQWEDAKQEIKHTTEIAAYTVYLVSANKRQSGPPAQDPQNSWSGGKPAMPSPPARAQEAFEPLDSDRDNDDLPL